MSVGIGLVLSFIYFFGENKMIDEQVMTDHFEHLVGGVAKAQRMMHLWNTTYKCDMRPQGKLHTKEELFEAKCKAEGFTQEQILCFYEL